MTFQPKHNLATEAIAAKVIVTVAIATKAIAAMAIVVVVIATNPILLSIISYLDNF